MKRKWPRRLLLVIWVLLLAANVAYFLGREWESSFIPSTYATLYYPIDVPTIRQWTPVERDHLQLDLACPPSVREWRVLTDGGKEQTAAGTKPVFRLDTTFSQLHVYRLIPLPEGVCQAVEVSVRFYSREFYAERGMERGDVYIVRANVPCGRFEQYAVSDWVDDYAYVGEEGLARVDEILKEEVGIGPGDPTIARMEKLYPYLREKLKNAGGVPADDERWMNPWLLYNALAGGTGKGWCTQRAQTWVFWANRAGIPTRFVFGARTEENMITYTGHSWGESFIKEQNRWAFVDLSHGQVFVTNRTGEVLNSAELFHLNQLNAFDSTFARVYVDAEWQGKPGFPGRDTIVTVPFSLCNDLVRGEFTPHAIFKYRRPPNVEDVRDIYTGFLKDRTFLIGNLERYLFKPPLAYSLYPTEGAETYCIRRWLFGGLAASFLLWLATVMIGHQVPGKTS